MPDNKCHQEYCKGGRFEEDNLIATFLKTLLGLPIYDLCNTNTLEIIAKVCDLLLFIATL